MLRKYKLYQNNLWYPKTIEDQQLIEFIENDLLNLSIERIKDTFFFRTKEDTIVLIVYKNIYLLSEQMHNDISHVDYNFDFLDFKIKKKSFIIYSKNTL